MAQWVPAQGALGWPGEWRINLPSSIRAFASGTLLQRAFESNDKLRGVVEVDETWVGPKGIGGGAANRRSNKRPVVALVDRERGKVRSFPIERVTLASIKPIMKEHVEVGSTIQTDENVVYHFMHDEFPDHDVVTHKNKEYSRRENGRLVTTNTVEVLRARR